MTITPPATAIVFDLFHTLIDQADASVDTIDQLEMVLIGLVDPDEE